MNTITVEYKPNHEGTGQDIFVDNKKVGVLHYGDLRQAPQDRRPTTMLNAEKGTRYHKDIANAKQWVKNTLDGGAA